MRQSRYSFKHTIVLLVVVALAVMMIGPSARAQDPASDSVNAAAAVGITAAVNTSIPYQGQLSNNGALAKGVYDFQFKLFDALSGGTQIGSTVLKDDVNVANGLFSTELDFGAAAFNGQARWLEIGVRAGTSTAVPPPLSPRRPLLAVPYALYSLASAGGSGANPAYGSATGAPANSVFVKANGFVGINNANPGSTLDIESSGAAPNIPLRVKAQGNWQSAIFESPNLAAIQLRPAGGDTDRVELANGLDGSFRILTYGPGGREALKVARNGSTYMGGNLWMADPAYGDGGLALSHDKDDSLVINAVNTFPGGVRIQSGVTIGRPGTPAGLGVIGAATVDGPMTVNGTTTTKVLRITGGDLAEPFTIVDADTIEPGMVVAIDPNNPGQMRRSTAAYDHTVAGVISGAGGINVGVLMYKDGATPDAHPVALSGRVYVYADATNGAIQPGDLLTTSATPGHAMKVTDHERAQGAILGKAMSKLEAGTGLVLVLVTLQ